MSHHHSDHHHHSHPDHPHHHHPHDDDAGHEPAAEQKLATLLEHWIKHNESHVQSYREWAQKASALGMHEVRAQIEEAVELTLAANRKFEEALKQVREKA